MDEPKRSVTIPLGWLIAAGVVVVLGIVGVLVGLNLSEGEGASGSTPEEFESQDEVVEMICGPGWEAGWGDSGPGSVLASSEYSVSDNLYLCPRPLSGESRDMSGYVAFYETAGQKTAEVEERKQNWNGAIVEGEDWALSTYDQELVANAINAGGELVRPIQPDGF